MDWVGVLRYISLFGDAALWSVVALNLFWLGKRRLGGWLLAALLLDVALNKVLKYALAVPRPNPSKWLVPVEDPYGLPSGHSETAALAASFLSLAYGRRWAYSLLGLALAVALSRFFLGVHSPRDVAAGLAIGAPLGTLFHVLYRKIDVKPAHLRLASLPVALAGFAAAMCFPVRPALFGGFIAGAGLAMVLSKPRGAEVKLSGPKLMATLAVGNAVLVALLVGYAIAANFLMKFATAFLAAVWALAAVPAIQRRQASGNFQEYYN